MVTPQRAFYLKYIYKKNERFAELKRQKKIQAVEYKGGVCYRCKRKYLPCVFDFHHLDPETKTAHGSQFLCWSWERIKTELDKCVMLCSNCHRITHDVKHKQNRSRQPKRS